MRLLQLLTARTHVHGPAQGKRDGSTKDEPFAWDAREALRKLVIGQVRGASVPQAVPSVPCCSSMTFNVHITWLTEDVACTQCESQTAEVVS